MYFSPKKTQIFTESDVMASEPGAPIKQSSERSRDLNSRLSMRLFDPHGEQEQEPFEL